MEPDLNAPLTPEEFASLRAVGKGATQRIIPDAHTARLLELGFIKEAFGGWILTDIGSLRAAKGR